MISASDLPIAVNSHLRNHTSPIPGLLLTHEHGYHTGGIGPSAHIIEGFAQRFIAEREIKDVRALESAVAEEMERKIDEVRRRMGEREEAVEKNRAVERELGDLKLQRQAELRVMEKMKGKR
jgi:phosphoribosyl 1,2-cyclic phosphodiesterase